MLKSSVDLLNYEPSFTMDIAVLQAIPIGEYENDKLVNLGLNRWYARVALPMKYHLGTFTPGYKSSIEFIPSVWFFGENNNFLGRKLNNDPLWQLEGHLTQDFTSSFFGSLDMIYQIGIQSSIDGNEVGEQLEIGILGFTFNYQFTDNFIIRTSYSSKVFSDNNLETSFIRLQIVYGWHRSSINTNKLMNGH